MFEPKTKKPGKSNKIVGVPPEFPETGGMQHQKSGSPARKSTLAIKKPGGR